MKLDLGYRRIMDAAGRWVCRQYLGEQEYASDTFADADDLGDANGVDILNFHQAQVRARELAAAAAEEERLAALGPPLDARRAVEEYLEEREERHGQHGLAGTKTNARARLMRDVLSNKKFASTLLAALTVAGLAALKLDKRTANDLRAALNMAARRYRDQLPPTLRDVIKDGLAGSHAPARAPRDAQAGLPDADVRRLVAAAREVDEEGGWGGGLAGPVMVMAAAGPRFSQVARMRVADVQAAQGRLMIPTSRKGRGVKASSHTAVRVGPDVLQALAPATAGRLGHEPLFVRPSWRLAGPLTWKRSDDRKPWRSSNDLRAPFAAIVAKAGLPSNVTPYALRHSSICRALRAGLPVQLVARLHDTSAAMIEKNYSAQIVSLMDELAGRAIIPLVTTPATVTPIQRARR